MLDSVLEFIIRLPIKSRNEFRLIMPVWNIHQVRQCRPTRSSISLSGTVEFNIPADLLLLLLRRVTSRQHSITHRSTARHNDCTPTRQHSTSIHTRHAVKVHHLASPTTARWRSPLSTPSLLGFVQPSRQCTAISAVTQRVYWKSFSTTVTLRHNCVVLRRKCLVRHET